MVENLCALEHGENSWQPIKSNCLDIWKDDQQLQLCGPYDNLSS